MPRGAKNKAHDLPIDDRTLSEFLPYLNQHERSELDFLLSQGPLWVPIPGSPQMDAYFCPADELYYGGQAGGGKTDLVLGLAVSAHRKSIVFRRELKQAIEMIDRSRQIIGQHGSYNGQYHIWRYLPGGRSLQFGGVKALGDEEAYKGLPHDLKAFDEIGDFAKSQYRFLIAWNRSTDQNQRCRVVCTGNPPTTPEGLWVIEYWGPWLDPKHPKPALPGELRWYAVIEGEDVEVDGPEPIEHNGELLKPKSRTFIPASLQDNPFLKSTNYETVLQNLPEPLRSRLLKGDYTVGMEDHPWQVIPTAWVVAAQERWKKRVKPARADALGVDVARGGQAKTVLAPRSGNYFHTLQKYPGKTTSDGPAVCALLAAFVSREGQEVDLDINIDAIGVGSSAYDTARGQLHDNDSIRVHAIIVSQKSNATDHSTHKLKFRNLRAQVWWHFREALDPERGDDVALPPDSELLADLCAPRWSLTMSGILVEAKEDIIDRIGRSPDSGDAVVLASYIDPPKRRIQVLA